MALSPHLASASRSEFGVLTSSPRNGTVTPHGQACPPWPCWAAEAAGHTAQRCTASPTRPCLGDRREPTQRLWPGNHRAREIGT